MILEAVVLALGLSSVASYETTGKGLADHAVSAVSGQDCKIANSMHDKPVCERVAYNGKKKMYKLTLDDGTEIKCTANHVWVLSDNSLITTDKLKFGDSLKVMSTKLSSDNFLNGYEMIQDGEAAIFVLDTKFDPATDIYPIPPPAGNLAFVETAMNRIQQEAIAKAVGMTRDDLAKSLVDREAAAKLGAKEVEKAIGETATTAGVKLPSDPSSEMFQFTKDIEGKFGSGSSVKNLYEDSKAAFDNALAKGTAKDVTDAIAKSGQNVPASTVSRVEKLFVDSKGNPYSGDVVVNNLKYDNPDFSKLTEKEQQLAKKALNDFVESKGFGRPEELARQWSEKEFVAKAKDTLPQLFQSKNYKTINTQMQNFGKDPAGVKSFKQELGYALKKMPIDDARAMWSSVGPNVNKWLVKDPAEFKKITDMINQAKDKQAVNRAASLLIKSGFAAREAFKEED